MTPDIEKLGVVIVCADDFMRSRLEWAAEETGLFAPVIPAEDGYMAMAGVWEGIAAGQPPDLVLADLNLPSFDGVDLTREVRRHPETRPLFVALLDFTQAHPDPSAAELAGADFVGACAGAGADLVETLRLIGQQVILGSRAGVF